ncbi:hypothetical protein BANRA_04112 [Acinetobacter baumannii]|nr:hypothetical protein BANRA_04112 [Acinetobacter baumannii]
MLPFTKLLKAVAIFFQQYFAIDFAVAQTSEYGSGTLKFLFAFINKLLHDQTTQQMFYFYNF